jgi:hypothetical protein
MLAPIGTRTPSAKTIRTTDFIENPGINPSKLTYTETGVRVIKQTVRQ